MEGGEKKRKKAEIGEADGGGRRRKKEDPATPPPTEEEVEEFFAILRRIRVAVKYFQNNNTSGDPHDKLPDSFVPALETAVDPKPVDDVVIKVGVNSVLDLNSIPDGESNGEF